MYRLPLFPLPVVLLPTEILPLHVFEPRYRRLVDVALEGDRRFGIVYHDPDRMGPFLNEEGRVGCLAEIQAQQALEDGRSLILTRGVERFAIREGIESKEPFYEAVAEPYLDEPRRDPPEVDADRDAGGALDARDDEEDADGRGPDRLRRLRETVRQRFLEIARGRAVDADALPDFDLDGEISFPLSALVEADVRWKQRLLEERSELRRLTRLDAALRSLDLDPHPRSEPEAP